ncbi:MAG: divalent metal cation transporter [Candidatus Obscuribacterales bacterium]|nr:divalent metal cation transporter [Cyanobacteria bacterium SZAS LIN-5]RTL40785.1 MAG: divalent metal cation transporter [Candidatus Melainabacteria bacterium]
MNATASPNSDDLTPRQKAIDEKNPIKRFFLVLGPGLITGASDDDPSGIGTYSVAGASLGFSTLWLALVTLPMMAAVQYSCAKIGMVTGQGLAGVLKKNYPKPLLYLAVAALFVANTLNVGADIGAIAAAIQLLHPVPIMPTILLVSVSILVVQFLGSYKLIANVFKWLTVVLFAYIATAFFVHVNVVEVLKATFIPTFQPTAEFVSTLVAILGTTISPYLFFWQASQQVEEDRSEGKRALWQRRGASDEELKVAAMDVNAGMVLSNSVMYFIIFTCAATLHAHGQTHIATATDAAKALAPVAGKFSELLLAIGLIGTGLLAIPILTGSAAYALSEAFGWRYGLDEKPYRAKQFYAVIAVSTVVGMAMNFFGMNAIAALFWSAVINGLVAPPLLFLIMMVVNNKEIMGDKTNSVMTNVMGWASTAAMTAAAVALFFTWGK